MTISQLQQKIQEIQKTRRKIEKSYIISDLTHSTFQRHTSGLKHDSNALHKSANRDIESNPYKRLGMDKNTVI